MWKSAQNLWVPTLCYPIALHTAADIVLAFFCLLAL